MLVQIAGTVALCMRPLIGSYLVIAAMLAAELASYDTSILRALHSLPGSCRRRVHEFSGGNRTDMYRRCRPCHRRRALFR